MVALSGDFEIGWGLVANATLYLPRGLVEFIAICFEEVKYDVLDCDVMVHEVWVYGSR